ncbi:MAG: N-acetylmuramoyl-L-alanine amidase [Vicinamibacterales bacterium]
MSIAITPRPCAPRNFRRGRPEHLRIEAVVIHVIDGTLVGADATFADNALDIPRSAHYAVGRRGQVHQYVDERDTAFHAGTIVSPTWTGLKHSPGGGYVNPNFYTIGIEHEGLARQDWPEAMYAASAELLRQLASRYPALNPLSRRNVVMHREIRATKSCPGHVCDINRILALAGDGPTTGAITTQAPMQLRTRSVVNVRRGAPSTMAPIARVIPAGEVVNVVRQTTGESVNGISRWWQNVDDDFLWAGALET